MCRLSAMMLSFAVSIAHGSLASSALSAPAVPTASPPAAPGSGSGFHHFHHYGHYHHYGHFGHYGHYRHYGSDSAGTSPATSPDGSGSTAGNEQGFMRDGHRYYWHNRNGHRFYSSHPEPGDTVGPDPGIGEDLDAPLSREERAQRAARMQHAQARLATVEKRVARQRHLMHLRQLAAKPKPRRNGQRK